MTLNSFQPLPVAPPTCLQAWGHCGSSLAVLLLLPHVACLQTNYLRCSWFLALALSVTFPTPGHAAESFLT